MHFLTEDDIRARCPQPGCSLTLAAGERLTPSAAEFAARMRAAIVREGAVPPVPAPPVRNGPGVSRAAGDEPRAGMTCLDAETTVPKSHPRIMLRGKLDTLLASAILARTRFDPENNLSPYLKECLADVVNWVMGVLTAEVSGGECAEGFMGGMDAPALRAVSRDPRKYLGMDPPVPGIGMGENAALLNWLRALARETEVAAVRNYPEREDIASSLNRLSSAVYVLVLLTLAAENGIDVATIRQG